MEIEKAEAAKEAAIAEEQAAQEKAKKEAEKLKRKSSRGTFSGPEDEKALEAEQDEGSQHESHQQEIEEHEDNEEDDFAYRVYFIPEEIRKANEMQHKDYFENIVYLKHLAKIENSESNQ